MYQLSRSLRTLTIVIIAGNDLNQNLTVHLIEPLFISGPTEWTGNEASIETVSLETGREGVAFVDQKNGVRVVAETFEVAENVKHYKELRK